MQELLTTAAVLLAGIAVGALFRYGCKALIVAELDRYDTKRRRELEETAATLRSDIGNYKQATDNAAAYTQRELTKHGELIEQLQRAVVRCYTEIGHDIDAEQWTHIDGDLFHDIREGARSNER